MNLLKTSIVVFFLALLAATISSATLTRKPATMNLPENFVQEFVTKSLPLEFRLQSSNLLGSVSVDKISNLQLKQDKLSGYATLSGHRLDMITDIGGHQLHMKIGTLTMHFQCEITVRFDARKQVLYLRPVVTELQSTDRAKTELASSIALLFNNRELPLSVDKLTPMVTNTGNKELSLSLKIADIRLQPDNLLLHIIPQLRATPRK